MAAQPALGAERRRRDLDFLIESKILRFDRELSFAVLADSRFSFGHLIISILKSTMDLL
jgi:hypothetical protein